jgi:hypothetical protein
MADQVVVVHLQRLVVVREIHHQLHLHKEMVAVQALQQHNVGLVEEAVVLMLQAQVPM